MSIGIISNDKEAFGLAVGISVLVGALVVVWGRPRKWPALWALVSLVAVAGTAVGAWAAFRGTLPATPSAAIATPTPPGTAPPTSVPPPPTSSPSACTPNGPDLHITAAGIAFDPDCLAAPAGTAFTITFDNKDAGTPHNIHIFSADPTKDPNAQSLFMGALVTGPDTATYEVSALPEGTYFFHCDVHPTQMFGTFVSG